MTDLNAFPGGNAAPHDRAAYQDFDFHLDPWIAASVLQKAIRRGEAGLATRAAEAFGRTRGKGLWRRLLIIAFEDVSIGAPEAVIEAVDLCATAMTRNERGVDTTLLARLVHRLAEAPKDRAPDHLFTTATFSPHLDHVRRAALRRSSSGLVAVVADASAPVVERALAASVAVGRDEPCRMRSGDWAAEAIFQAFRDLGVPAELVTATRDAVALTRELLPIATPLLWLAAESSSCRPVEAQAVLSSPSLAGVPAYGLDKHTRAGKAAILRFARENGPVSDALSAAAPAERAGAVACMAVFHAEGAAIRVVQFPALWGASRDSQR